MTSQATLSIVVPLYRDFENLGALFDRVGAVIGQLDRRTELILVDDGSQDGTAERATELAEGVPYPTTVIRLWRNFGQHPAVFAGLERAVGDVVVTMDSDLQYPPEEIPRMLAELSADFPVVSGYREHRADPWPRRLITHVLSSWMSRRTGSPLRDYGSMFRAYDRSVVDQLLRFSEQRRYIPGLVGWLRVPVKEIPVGHQARGEKGSRYRLGSLVDMFLDLITGYTAFPLRLVMVIGFVGAFLGFVATSALFAYRIVAGSGPAGLVSAVAALFFLAGIQLLALGTVGEYVGRVYIESKDRPYFLVKSVIQNDASVRPSR